MTEKPKRAYETKDATDAQLVAFGNPATSNRRTRGFVIYELVGDSA